jgi:nitrous oxidase accessory protein
MMRNKILLRTLLGLLPLLAVILVSPAAAQSAGRVVTPQGTYDSLKEALVEARAGDRVKVYGGIHRGPISIDRSLTLVGHDWPVIDGGGQGTVLKLAVPNITLRGFVIRDSGSSLDQENSGIAVEAPDAILENLRLEETLFGIYLRQADNGVIRNSIIFSKDLPVPRRGDPIRVWYSNGVLIENNTVNKGRDVVLWYSERLTVRDNEVSQGRYGLHFMYCDDATIENNLLTDNSVGTFLMYSRRLNLLGNTIARNRGPSGFGVGLKDMDDAIVKDNLFLDNRVGAHLDNSPREINSIGRFEGNVFAYNDVGINLMPSVRHNEFSGNSFVDNEQQVSIAGGGGQAQANNWTAGETGNYWSDYVGYDGDADGNGDIPYRAERLFENLMDQNSSLRLFMYSPVEQAVEFAARAVPFVKPQPKLTDYRPLMSAEVPDGLPPVPEADQRPMWFVSVALVLLAMILMMPGAVKRSGLGRRPARQVSLVPSTEERG